MAADKFLRPGYFSGGSKLSDGSLEAIVNERVNYIGPFSNGTRPALLATWVALGFPAIPDAGPMIFNTDDNAPNIWDGAAWRDMAGNVT